MTDMPTVEFVYEKTCPYIDAARKRLIEAFSVVGITPAWSEWEVSDPNAPDHVRPYGSPTILVDGKDVTGLSVEEASSCCRIYALDGEERGVPPLDQVVTALTVEMKPPQYTGSLRLNMAVLPSVGAALLPKLTCPACWPAYAGLLSSMGVSFIDYTPYLMPLTGFFLAVSVLALGYRASVRRGYGPFWLGAIAAAAVLVGKFGFDSDPVMWASLGVLVVASVWNTWPRRRGSSKDAEASCSACIGANT
ncbi:hypothetical protein V5T82_04285 [Magnetovibrio sp. PR-2]|uniref:MerC family mercury resistance protein n=1 Tax=Magnetovibrio sp. PR-2 TaxID=3120356 RepID=UPI002FCDEC68